jgi:hypothetical protein
MNEPELGAGIDPSMSFSPFTSSIWIRQDSNPQPLDRESSLLTTRPDLRPRMRLCCRNSFPYEFITFLMYSCCLTIPFNFEVLGMWQWVF